MKTHFGQIENSNTRIWQSKTQATEPSQDAAVSAEHSATILTSWHCLAKLIIYIIAAHGPLFPFVP